MAGSCTRVIRRIGIFVWRLVRLMPPVQRLAPVCPPLHFVPFVHSGCKRESRRKGKSQCNSINHKGIKKEEINAEKFNRQIGHVFVAYVHEQTRMDSVSQVGV
jgi:hypothetical protein